MVGDVPMINDSCGRNYPWYGSKNQGKIKLNFFSSFDGFIAIEIVITIQGPIHRQTDYTISMRDLFAPWIPW
jgi:hypothetical protein